MRGINWSTAVAFLGTVICVTGLAAYEKPIPAAISGLLGAFATTLLPALMKTTEDDK